MQFEKISYEQWRKDFIFNGFTEKQIKSFYDKIIIPQPKTKGAACHDFIMPFSCKLPPKSELLIPTGIRWNTEGDYGECLVVFPRSGLGFRHGLRLKNTIGMIDPDYCESSNEGHILVALVNPSEETVDLPRGKGFVQGWITGYKTIGEASQVQRDGGYGSTDKEK